MPVLLQTFVQGPYESAAEWTAVSDIADQLLAHLNEPGPQTLLAKANMPGQSSGLVQASFLSFAQGLGFADESKGLFSGYATSAVRPDYHLPLPQYRTGILLEVERGKTTINNMDFLDFWKCHLCEHANYLFLMVPQTLVQSTGRAPTKPFAAVVKRMSSFFVPRNYTNVRGLAVFGY